MTNPPLNGKNIGFTQGWYNNPGGFLSHRKDSPLNKYGYDLNHGMGLQVYAMNSGTVIKVVEKYEDNGCKSITCANSVNEVHIDHGDGYVSQYLHLQKNSVSVNVGDPIFAGQKIAKQGNSGYSFGTHLHVGLISKKTGVSVPFLIPGLNPNQAADVDRNKSSVNLVIPGI